MALAVFVPGILLAGRMKTVPYFWFPIFACGLVWISASCNDQVSMIKDIYGEMSGSLASGLQGTKAEVLFLKSIDRKNYWDQIKMMFNCDHPGVKFPRVQQQIEMLYQINSGRS
eukprot:TRINITY_DN2638_c0_g1_i1.p1 TRINITY_DN2638_c0_g1~~TRINITY_DN2638_c0_g1_i1.p1  ORF type:complete len:114 (-),score=22.58 TRINITY_DN2638_c0_g1_i1:3-344(-)